MMAYRYLLDTYNLEHPRETSKFNIFALMRSAIRMLPEYYPFAETESWLEDNNVRYSFSYDFLEDEQKPGRVFVLVLLEIHDPNDAFNFRLSTGAKPLGSDVTGQQIRSSWYHFLYAKDLTEKLGKP